MLKIFKRSKLKSLWISSRNYNLLDELENELSVFSYTLNKFSVLNQREFLQKFWEFKLDLKELDTHRFTSFTDPLLDQLSKSISYHKNHEHFLSIPLHILMIAECFEENFKSYYNDKCIELTDDDNEKLNKKISLATLYKSFIEKKFYTYYCEEKHKISKKNQILLQFELLYANFLDELTILALCNTFEQHNLKNMFPDEKFEKIPELFKKIKEEGEKVGIIIKITDGKPFFVHLTFAEYLVGNYIWKKFKSVAQGDSRNLIKNVIVTNIIRSEKVEICNFLQSIACEDFENSKQYNFEKEYFKLNLLLQQILNEKKIINQKSAFPFY